MHQHQCSSSLSLLNIFVTLNISLTVFGQSVEYVLDRDIISEKIIEFHTSKSKFGESTYLKFQANYKRLTVCGLSISQRREACNSVLNGPRYKYILVADERWTGVCKPFTAKVEGKGQYSEIAYVGVVAFKCPVAFRVEVNATRDPIRLERHRGVIYHISGSADPSSLIMYYAHVGLKYATRAQPDVLVQNVPYEWFKAVKDLDRALLFALNSEAVAEKPPPYPTGDLLTNQRFTGMFGSILRDPIQTEDSVKDLVNLVIENESPYQKFINSYNNVNLCGLSMEQILYVCQRCFQNHVYNLLIGYSLRGKPECQRKDVYYSHDSMIQFSPPVSINLIQCNVSGPKADISYYASTSSVANMIIMYIHYLPHREILPDGTLSNFTVHVLKQIDELDRM